MSEIFLPEHTDRPAVNIGPGSLVWKYAGDWRIAFTVPSAELLQVMHPGLAAGVHDHSEYVKTTRGKIQRVLRSVGPIMGVIYDEKPEVTAQWIRDQHINIAGTYHDSYGNTLNYHALNPEIYWWAHATFQNTMVRDVIERFDEKGLSDEAREQLVREGAAWYSRYGLSSRPVPQDLAHFEEKWNDICDNTLQMTSGAKKLLRLADRIPSVRRWTIGGLPARVRERFELPWTEEDQEKLSKFEDRVKRYWPERGLYIPRAAKAMERTA